MKKLLLLSLALFTTATQADTTKIEFLQAWIKQLPPVVPVRAGYMQIKNSSLLEHEIIALQSDAFDSVEMHETLMHDGMMKMEQQKSIVIPSKGLIELKPGGKHLMLIKPKQALQIGDRINLTVTFADQTSSIVQLEVKK